MATRLLSSPEEVLIVTVPSFTRAPSPIADGRYDVHELIGRGTTARVHRGHDLLLHRDVAVKLVPAPDAQAADRFWAREVDLRARLEADQVPGLFDCGRADDETAFVVLQLAPGGTLTERLDDGPLDLDATVALTCTLAHSLGRMHANGVRHGDVSSDAVLSDARGLPLWCGFARVPSPEPVTDDADALARLALACRGGAGSAADAAVVRTVLEDVVHRGGAAFDQADRLRDVLLAATRGTDTARRRPAPHPMRRLRLGGERRSGAARRRRGLVAAASVATVAVLGFGAAGLADAASSRPVDAASATLAAPGSALLSGAGATSEPRIVLPSPRSTAGPGRSASPSVTAAMAGSRSEGHEGSRSSGDDPTPRTSTDDASDRSSGRDSSDDTPAHDDSSHQDDPSTRDRADGADGDQGSHAGAAGHGADGHGSDGHGSDGSGSDGQDSDGSGSDDHGSDDHGSDHAGSDDHGGHGGSGGGDSTGSGSGGGSSALHGLLAQVV